MQGQYRGDFTRDTFNPAKHFSRVLLQQGRVQLDADSNEQAAILLDYLRKQAADLIGPHGGPGTGFNVEPLKLDAGTASAGDFVIDPGRYYVDGFVCENDGAILMAQPVANKDGTSPTQLTVTTGLAAQLSSAGNSGYVEISDDNFQSSATKKVQIGDIGKNGQTFTLPDSLSDLGFKNAEILWLRRVNTYLTQADYPSPDSFSSVGNFPAYLVYLDVWEKHVTCVENDSIREVALGGPDTASRAKVVWQVKLLGLARVAKTPKDWRSLIDGTWPQLRTQLAPFRGFLRARVQPQAAATDPCTISPDAKYRGPENHLYRVEIHDRGISWTGNTDSKGVPVLLGKEGTFKWSRENGSILFPILNLEKGSAVVSLAHLGRDERLSLSQGDWVEIVDDDSSLLESERNAYVPLYRVQSVDRLKMSVTLDQNMQGDTGSTPGKHPFLRRWDHPHKESTENGLALRPNSGATLIVEGTDGDNWLTLECGVQIQFQKGGTYRPGDYWLIPARVNTGDIEWPVLRDAQRQPILDANHQPIPDALPPHGVEHHYAPLAVAAVSTAGAVSVTAPLWRTISSTAQPIP